MSPNPRTDPMASPSGNWWPITRASSCPLTMALARSRSAVFAMAFLLQFPRYLAHQRGEPERLFAEAVVDYLDVRQELEPQVPPELRAHVASRAGKARQ